MKKFENDGEVPCENMNWSYCDECNSFIPLSDYENGAKREFMEPDSHFGPETYETLCKKCNKTPKTN